MCSNRSVARRGDQLAEDGVTNVSGGEEPLDGCFHPFVGNDPAILGEDIVRTLEKVRLGDDPHEDEDGVEFPLIFAILPQILEDDRGDFISVAFYLLKRVLHQELDVRVALDLLDQVVLRPESVFAVGDGDMVGQLGKVDRIGDGGIASADDENPLASEKGAVARSAVGNALAGVGFFTFNLQVAVFRSGCIDNGFGFVGGAACGLHEEVITFLSDCRGGFIDDLRSEGLRLTLELQRDLRSTYGTSIPG